MFFNFFFWIFGACFQLKIPTYLSRRILSSLFKKAIYFLISKVTTKFSWTYKLEFWAENMPQKSEKKVEEHKAPSEFRSDA